MGEVKFYYGVMGAGKSTLLAQISHNMHSRGLEVATLKPGIDTKGDDHIISRMGTGHKADMIVSPEANVRETVRAHMGKRGVKLSTLVVDEAQFLTPDQADELVEGAVYDDYDVFAGGLRTNVYKELFPGSKRLFEVAHHCIELTLPNPCRCGEQAVFNGRWIDGVFDINSDGPVNLIDGSSADMEYDVFCHECFDKHVEASRLLQQALTARAS